MQTSSPYDETAYEAMLERVRCVQTGDIAGFRPIPPGEFRVQGNLFKVAIEHDQLAMLRFLTDSVHVPLSDTVFWDVFFRQVAWRHAISTGKLWAADVLVPDRSNRRFLARHIRPNDVLFDAVRSRSMAAVRYITEDIGVPWTDLRPTRFENQSIFESMLFRAVCQSGTGEMLQYFVDRIYDLHNVQPRYRAWKFVIGMPTLIEALVEACSVAHQNEETVRVLFENTYYDECTLRCALRESVLFSCDQPTPVAKTVLASLCHRNNHGIPVGHARYRNWSIRKRLVLWRRSSVENSKSSCATSD